MNSPHVNKLLSLGPVRALREKENALFDPFDVLGIEHYELRHTTVLTWLLDPAGSHGLRETFLRQFLLGVGLQHLCDRALLCSNPDIHVIPEVGVVKRAHDGKEWRFGSKQKSGDKPSTQVIQEKVDKEDRGPERYKAAGCLGRRARLDSGD